MLLARDVAAANVSVFLNRRAMLDILFSVDAAPALPRRVSPFVLSFCSLFSLDLDRALSINSCVIDASRLAQISLLSKSLIFELRTRHPEPSLRLPGPITAETAERPEARGPESEPATRVEVRVVSV